MVSCGSVSTCGGRRGSSRECRVGERVAGRRATEELGAWGLARRGILPASPGLVCFKEGCSERFEQRAGNGEKQPVWAGDIIVWAGWGWGCVDSSSVYPSVSIQEGQVGR